MNEMWMSRSGSTNLPLCLLHQDKKLTTTFCFVFSPSLSLFFLWLGVGAASRNRYDCRKRPGRFLYQWFDSWRKEVLSDQR